MSRPRRESMLGSEGLGPLLEGFGSPRRWWRAVRHPAASLRQIAGDGPVGALVVLFGLNAVDELDRTGFGILLPTIRDHFGMSDTGITTLVAVSLAGALLLQLPIAVAADRGNRVRVAVLGAIAWGAFSFLTGLATTIWILVVARVGSGIGRAVTDPTHNSLLSDFYPIDRRPAVFSFHRGANALGQFVGPLLAGGLAAAFDWRVPFLVFAVPTAVLVVAAMRLREPVRGIQERRASGMDEAVAATEELRPSFAEAWRTVWKVEVLRRIWYAIPFLAVSLVGFVSLASLLYEEVYGYGDFQRGVLAALVEPFQLVGLVIGARFGTRLLVRDPSLVFRFLRHVAIFAGAMVALFAVAPAAWVTVAANVAVTSALAILLPGLFSVLAMAIPPRARAMGFSVAAYWAIPGLLLVPAIGWLSDNVGIRWGMLAMTPVLVVGGLMVSSGGAVIRRDIADVWNASAARSQALVERREGRAPLLVVRDLQVSYGPVPVLTDIDLDVAEGQVVALLGTNGAGKSTLLKAISGVVEADFGAVIFDGRDITHAPPNEIAAVGVTPMPGGAGVFPSLTVRENLRVAGWPARREPARLAADTERVLATFPVLAERLDEPAANLSGGQQQMLALGMALLVEPRLLMIDELSLGLAPVVVSHLADIVRDVARRGTTIILVEQSVNVALTLARTAIFMEKGRIRFRGPTAELLDRPDLLRSVFLGDTTARAALPARPAPSGERAAGGGRPPLLEVVDLSVDFGGNRALDGVSMSVEAGEIVGLLGPNGAGKTTLVDAISGFAPLTRGRVLLGGSDLTREPAEQRARRGLGRSFQDARLFPGMTVREAIAVAADRWVEVRDPINPILGTPAAADSEAAVGHRVDELAGVFGLADRLDAFVGELSTGTRRIVDLACVVAHLPAVLLLDEPSTGIAQREAEALGPLVDRIRRELGCAIVVIEHDIPLLRSVADRFVALESGGVIAEGDPDAVLSHPAVVASYLGTSPEVIARSGPAAT